MQASTRYTNTAIVLHWLIAIAIFAMFALGWYMSDLPKDAPKQLAYDIFDWGLYTWQLNEAATPRTFYFNIHKSIGVTVFALILFRFFWRLSHKPPTLLASYKAYEKKLATGVHHFLYLLMFALPISGILMSLFSKYGLMWFGIHLIDGLNKNDLRETFVEVHEIVGVILLVVLALHIVGAIKHALIDKDGTLKRMSIK